MSGQPLDRSRTSEEPLDRSRSLGQPLDMFDFCSDLFGPQIGKWHFLNSLRWFLGSSTQNHAESKLNKRCEFGHVQTSQVAVQDLANAVAVQESRTYPVAVKDGKS